MQKARDQPSRVGKTREAIRESAGRYSRKRRA